LTANTSVIHLDAGDQATILEFSNGFIACKLMAMGLLPGSPVEVVRKSPFGKTIYIRSGHHHVALRDNEAATIVIAKN
jgi:ferrous iron transport protein A